MGRGPSVKSIRKKAEAESFGRALGELKAQKKVDKGESKDIESYFQSLREHIGKALDRIDPLYLVVAVLGMKADENMGLKFPDTLHGAVFGMVALRMVESPSEIAALAGVAGLAVIGLTAAIGPDVAAFIADYNRQRELVNELVSVPDADKPRFDEYVRDLRNRATNLNYCGWYAQRYPNDPVPVACGG